MLFRFIKFVKETGTRMVEWKARNHLDILRICLGYCFHLVRRAEVFPRTVGGGTHHAKRFLNSLWGILS